MPHTKPRFRAIDAILLLLCIAVGIYIYNRVRFGLEYRGNWAAIPQFLFRRDQASGRWVANYLLQGLITTLKLSFWAMILALLVGLGVALLHTSNTLFFRMVGRTYIELIRNLPPLVLIFIFYFFVIDQIMPLLGIEAFIRSLSAGAQTIVSLLFAERSLFVQFISGVVTLAFFEGAYIAEIIRAGIESIERGQHEAAYALGLPWVDEMRFVVLPQVIKRVLPALANEFINTIKYSAIASVVSIQELTFMGRQVVVATRYIFEAWITVAALYMVLTLSLSLLTGRLEKRLRASD